MRPAFASGGLALALVLAGTSALLAQALPPPVEPLLRPSLPAATPHATPVRKAKSPLSTVKSTQPPPAGVPGGLSQANGSGPGRLGLLPPQRRAPGLPPLPAPLARKTPKPEADPWAPLGTQALGLVFKPSLVLDSGYDSNPNQLAGPHKGSAALATAAALDVQSDWVRHAFTANLQGALFRFPDDPAANRPASDSRAALRLDVQRDTSVEIGATNVLTTQRPGSIEQPEVGSKRANIDTFGGSLAVQQRFGAAALELKGLAGRSVYDDLQLADGSTVSQSDRNYATYGATLRASYEATPGVKPFVQGTLDERRYDQAIDAGGFMRSSSGVAASLGSTFELTRLLTGEIAAGYCERRYEDPRLLPLKGPILDASLIWSATALTTVKLRAATSLEETVVSNASGAVAQTVALDIEHALRRNLILSTAVAFTRTDYQGAAITEDAWSYGARLEWKLTRSLALRASAFQQRLHSTAPGNDYTANVVLVGLKLQH